MQNKLIRIWVLLIVLVSFSSCEAIKGIFKVGMGFGIFIVIAILTAIIFIISRFKK
jgi:hypothetical protein